jgi:metal iron transporter
VILFFSSVLLKHILTMNCPSRNDDTDKHPHWNQTPPALTADLTTRADLNGIANTRELDQAVDASQSDKGEEKSISDAAISGADRLPGATEKMEPEEHASTTSGGQQQRRSATSLPDIISRRARRLIEIITKYSQFIGPGFLIAVAYIDPGNYATDVNGTHHDHPYAMHLFIWTRRFLKI